MHFGVILPNYGDKEQYPELRAIPRTSPERVQPMLDAGAEGAIVSFPDEVAMCDFAHRYR